MSNENNKSYRQGQIDALELWGKTCSSQGNCESCPIGSLRGANVTCQDFAKQFPAKMLSILTEMNEKEITYYQEYCMRFPECNLSVEDLAEIHCRKAMFEGFLACDKDDDSYCVACWNEKYVGDRTEFPEEE